MKRNKFPLHKSLEDLYFTAEARDMDHFYRCRNISDEEMHRGFRHCKRLQGKNYPTYIWGSRKMRPYKVLARVWEDPTTSLYMDTRYRKDFRRIEKKRFRAQSKDFLRREISESLAEHFDYFRYSSENYLDANEHWMDMLDDMEHEDFMQFLSDVQDVEDGLSDWDLGPYRERFVGSDYDDSEPDYRW